MEQDLITYEDKVALDEQPSVADINKVKDTDMNQIKNVINGINNGSQPLNNLVVGNIEGKNLLPVESSFTVTNTQRSRDVYGLNLKANQEYILSCTDIESTNPYPYLFYFNVGQSSQFAVYLPNAERSITFTPTANVNTVRIYSSNAWNSSANYTTTYTNLMIEKGDTVTNYTPHIDFNNYENYSTDEIRIGTWINGKSLYRKVINFGTLPNNASKAYNIADLNIENLVNLSGIAKIGANDKYCFPLPYVTPKGTLAEGISLYKNDTNIEIVAGTDRSGYSAYIIIEYTKTTD